jgi:nucleoside 2-deoxyribosyltransferase
MNIYIASSWRNPYQPYVVALLRDVGCEVYDFKNPAPGNTGFQWSAIDPDWKNWTPDQYRKALQHPIAQAGYRYDIEALQACDACVLVLPSGRSASWELGYAMGLGKRGIVLQTEPLEPELMYREATFVTSYDELVNLFFPQAR